ncbi:MAG: GspH/FimT family pseudopilin [Nitrincola lacisaponensis]|uniref:GspH/FimT family pseudopilin n=1 Tax=Nitrincola lacisaponensis TaxID=267850 RepID=UPI00391DCAA4
MNPVKRQKGFSLIEILITIVVAAIILGLGIPSFRNMIINNRLVSQTNEIVGIVTTARSEAIRRNTSVSLCRVSTAVATQCVANAGTWDHWIIMAANGDIIQRGTFRRFGNTLNVTSTLTIDRIRFQGDGLARTGNNLVNDHRFRICSTQLPDRSRHVVLGAGSRQSVVIDSNGC